MATKKANKDLSYYLGLPWTYTVEQDFDNSGKKIYIVNVNELPGIQTDGYTIDEAFVDIKEAIEGAVKLYLKMGDRVPEPKKPDLKKYKGNISYRTTSEKHGKLAAEAKRRNLPINKVIDEIISKELSSKK